MSNWKENKFQSKLVKLLENRGAQVLNVHGHAMQKSGWPDLYIAHWKFHGWVELKVDRRKGTDVQSIVIRELRLRKIRAFFLRYDNSDETVQLDEVPNFCWKWQEITKENVVETLEAMWNKLEETFADEDFAQLLEAGNGTEEQEGSS